MVRQWRAHTAGSPDTWSFDEVAVPAPTPDEVTIRVAAAGVNPADAKHVAVARPGQAFPIAIGYEVSGTLSAVGPGATIGTGAVAHVGMEVIAFRIQGGFAEEITVPARDVFPKPAPLDHPAAANLLLTATTADEMLHVMRAEAGDTVILHGASGGVGAAFLQLAAARGVRVLGTASPSSFDRVRAFGGVPVAYGPGLEDRLRDAADGATIVAAGDAAGTDEAIDTSLALVSDRSRIVTIVTAQRAQDEGIAWIAGARPESARYRDAARGRLVALAGAGKLVVPVARTFPLAEAPAALAELATGHPGGAFALIP